MARKELIGAKKDIKNEFYTQLTDIEKELKHYREYLKDKVILCNCDDPESSNFWLYFKLNFNFLGIKKLIATHYEKENSSYKLEYSIIEEKNGQLKLDVVHTPLKGNGDFRSEECIELLKESDIVITNPPFNLFRDLIDLLITYDKDFILIGNTNALTYKEVFKLFQEDRIRTGYTNFNVGMFFMVPDSYKYNKIIDGIKYARVSNSCWFTSLPVNKHKEMLPLYRTYNEDEYPKYENFNAINVNRYTEIPCDYNGIMGVPVTFLDKYNPDQFELIGLGISSSGLKIGVKPYKPEHKKYRKEVEHKGAVDGDLYMIKDGIPDVPYARILIKRK